MEIRGQEINMIIQPKNKKKEETRNIFAIKIMKDQSSKDSSCRCSSLG
jgi:hypothetical protein